MNKDQKILAEILGKYLATRAEAIRQELEGIDEAVNELGKIVLDEETPGDQVLGEAPKPTLEEINSQKWTDKTSDKGAYQTTNKTDNQNSASFQKLQKYLESHKGFAILHGFKTWQFSNNQDILARRKQ